MDGLLFHIAEHFSGRVVVAARLCCKLARVVPGPAAAGGAIMNVVLCVGSRRSPIVGQICVAAGRARRSHREFVSVDLQGFPRRFAAI
jgi:hypothetical protein